MDLHPGLQLFHNGIPVELLFLVERKKHGEEEWLVRPLFVVKPNRTEVFHENDHYSKLHTQHA